MPTPNTPNMDLQQEDKIVQAYLDLSDLIILSLNPNGIVVDINGAGLKILGAETKTDIVGLNWLDRFVPEPDRSELREVFRSIREDKNFTLKEFGRHKNPVRTLAGKQLLISWQSRIIKNEDDEPVIVVAAGLDITNITAKQRELEQAEQKFQHMIETAHDITMNIGIDGIVSYVSPQVKRYGWQPSDIVGKNFLEFVHESDHQKLAQNVQRMLEDPNVTRTPTDVRLKKNDGDLVWFSVISGLLTDDAGKPISLTSVLRDIHDSKEHQQNIQQEKNKYETLFENALDGFVTLNREMFLDCNGAALKLYGLDDRNELIGLHPADMSPEKQPDGESSREKADRHIDEGYKFGKVKFDWVHRKKDGSLINCIVKLNRIIIDDQILLHGTVRDITEELEQAKKISESESLYRTLVESNPYYIKLISKDGKLISMNKAALKHHGHESIEAAKSHPEQMDYCPDTAVTASSAQDKARNGQTTTVNVNVVNAQNITVPFRMTFAPITGADGNVTEILIIGTDLSEKTSLEKKVSELDRIKSRLTTGLTRSIRGPLNKTTWALKILLSGEAAKLSPNQTVFAKQALQSSEELLGVMDSINLALDIERGTLKTESNQTTLDDIIKSVVSKYENRFSLDNIDFELQTSPEPKQLHVDPAKLSTAIQAMIDNAVKYQKDEGRSIKIRITDQPKEVRCEIEDSGIGIPSGERKNVFGLFQRASNAFSKHPNGLGIGLYNAESVIKAHGGQIGFTSEENRGSTFWFELPKN